MINFLFRKSTSGLLLLVIIAIFILICLPRAVNINLPTHQDTTPDWYMTNMTATTYDEQGEVKGILQSPKLVHYPKKNITHMKTPYFILYDKDRIPWHITSTYGKIYQDKIEKVYLWDNVIVQQMPAPHSDQTTLLTSELTYYPKTSFAHTNKPVTITQPDSEMQSIGFNANLKKGLIKFLSQSQMEYDDGSQ